MKQLLSVLFLVVLLTAGNVGAQVTPPLLTEWVQIRPPNASDEIALGYPVPIPVNTPLPFDGFRTYEGLHMRHQDLAANTDYVHAEQIGTTYAGRTIWAYRLGDADRLTIDGLPEPATLTNGGIHAREWQTPEVVTGILELLALHESDNHLYDYLRENVNMVVIPSLNIDGFLQTQRTPTLNYMNVDPDYPINYPRDGRMRRKNMRGADEDLLTTMDILNGVDLNRNNDPFWATNPQRSSQRFTSIVHHGFEAQSESETQALDSAAALGPVDSLRLYTDVHSFSLVHFWVGSDNDRLAHQTQEVLRTFSDHHVAFPEGKRYHYASRFEVAKNQGIGTTDEYFTHVYQVPSWTLEVEPSNGQSYHAPLPGSGADYGGISENGHDGFILPDSQIRRVREELAQSFAAVYYRQAGPPNIQALRVTDSDSGAIVYEAGWDIVNSQERELFVQQLRPLELNRDYDFWLSFNKPMRWRQNGLVVPFPGQSEIRLDVDTSVLVDTTEMTTTLESSSWLKEPGSTPDGYMNYQDDALRLRLRFDDDEQNNDLIAGGVDGTLKLRAFDMTGMMIDANPGTIANWEDGHWTRYENSDGEDSDFGGFDTSISFQISDQAVPAPFLLEAGITSSWKDRSHTGEGFLVEILENDRAVMYWYTYDDKGDQDWLFAPGEVHGNHIEFTNLYRASGGEFGPGFDPEKIELEDVGSASFIWSSCTEGTMSYRIGTQQGRLQLSRILSVLGLACSSPPESQQPPIPDSALLSGSWRDPTHKGEGFNLEMLKNDGALVYWFSYDKQGNRRWFFGVGENRDGKLVFDEMLSTKGGIFGPDFDPDTVEFPPWGSLEMDLDCNSGTATYNSTEEGFGSGVLNVERLTTIDGLRCP